MKKIFSLLLFLIILFLFASKVGAIPSPPRCEQYTYSTCPSYWCEKTCKSSVCSWNICTADCDWPWSCHLPVAKSCIKLWEGFDFYTKNQFCCDWLTRAPWKDTKNIIPWYDICIKKDKICDSKYENSWNSPIDCKNQLEKFKIIWWKVELLNDKYTIKKWNVLKITTLINTTKINSNASIKYDTVIYDENWNKIDSCVKKSTRVSFYINQIKTYCELNYFKTHSPDWKKYKIFTQIKIRQNWIEYTKDLSNSFIIWKKEEIKICNLRYDPVCWEKSWIKKTYSNKCFLDSVKAKLLYRWICKKIEEIKIPNNCISWYDWCNTCSVKDWIIWACTERYCIRHDTPKCLKYKKEEIVCPVFKLIAPKEGCHYDYIKDKNDCKIPKLICKEQKYKYKLTDSLKKRIQWVVEKFMQKLKYSKMSNEAKIRKIESIIEKLKILSNKKPSLKNIFDYLIELMEEEAVMLNIGF